MLDVLSHADLPHEAVLVAVHACQVSNVREDVLQSVSQLESFDVAKSILDMRVYDKFYHAKDLSAKMESIAKPALFALFCSQRLHWLQIEVVVQVEEVQIFPMDQKIEHVVALATDL